mmetsp:Transcript_4066/g.9788  ORF Transcript_4066/g.9788 Transcript_4066/m.9788 type:complete len:89 (+) Transcript_4066:162-428(+)
MIETQTSNYRTCQKSLRAKGGRDILYNERDQTSSRAKQKYCTESIPISSTTRHNIKIEGNNNTASSERSHFDPVILDQIHECFRPGMH